MTDSKAMTMKEAHQCFHSEREELCVFAFFWSVTSSGDRADPDTTGLQHSCSLCRLPKGIIKGSLYVHVTGTQGVLGLEIV